MKIILKKITKEQNETLCSIKELLCSKDTESILLGIEFICNDFNDAIPVFSIDINNKTSLGWLATCYKLYTCSSTKDYYINALISGINGILFLESYYEYMNMNMKENQQKNLTRIQLTKDSAIKLDNIKKMLCSNDEETAKLAIGILNEEFPTYAMKDSLYQKCGSIIFITRPLINQDPITLIISIENILKQGYYIFDFDNETIQIIEKTENNVGEFNSNVTIKR